MTFFFISFYFSYKTIIKRNIIKIKLRFKRIIIPYIGWPLIFFIKDKLLFGCEINGIFWFIFVLLFLSLFFAIIIFIFKKKYILVLFVICIFNYYLYHSKLAIIYFFNKYKYVPVHHSIKPIFYYILNAFSGFYLSSLNLIEQLYNHRFKFITLSSLLIIIYCIYYDFIFGCIHFSCFGLIENFFTCNLLLYLH